MTRFLLCLPLVVLLTAGQKAAVSEPLPEPDPLAFLEKALARFDEKDIRGYTAILRKQERIQNELKPSEEIDIAVRTQPHSVFMRWLKGERKAISALYVEGENDGQMLAKPTGLAGRIISYVRRDPEGEDARQSGRYSIKDVGLRKASERTLEAWRAARKEGTLQVEYLGIRKVREAGDRPCYTLRRRYAKPEEDGVIDGTFYFDQDSWFQVGTVLKAEGGRLMGEYFFRDIRLNPEFKPTQFQPTALTQ